MSNKTVAVTGANGFVGRAVIDSLSTKNRKTIALVREVVRSHSEFPVNCELRVVGNLSSETDWGQALAGVDVVVHCAARAHVMRDESADPIALYREVNVEATRRLAQQACVHGVRRLVFVSSVKAIGERSLTGRPLSVSDEPRPENAYGVSKSEAEGILSDLGASMGLETVIVRPPLVYGPGVKGNFLRLLDLVDRRIPLPLGGLDNARSLVYIGNLVDLLYVCIDSPAAAGKSFFVSDGEDLSTTSLVQRIAAAMSRPIRLIPAPTGVLKLLGRWSRRSLEVERLIGNLQVDIGPNREYLGWAPPYQVDVGLREVVAWYRRRKR